MRPTSLLWVAGLLLATQVNAEDIKIPKDCADLAAFVGLPDKIPVEQFDIIMLKLSTADRNIPMVRSCQDAVRVKFKVRK